MSARDIYGVANQLGGYVSSATEKHLAAFLLREADEAGKLADRITALEMEVEELRNQLKTAEQLRVFWNDKAIELAARFIPSARIKAEGREATNDSP